MLPRRKTDAQAKPQSVLNVVLAVKRTHGRAGYSMMVSTSQLALVLNGAKRAYIMEHGPESLAPDRKEPYNPGVMAAVRGLALGTRIAGYSLDWTAVIFVVCWGAINLTREAGFRKAEVTVTDGAAFGLCSLSFASISWRIGGILYAAPTVAALNSLAEGDAVCVKPNVAKNDQHGEAYSSHPIWIPFVESVFSAATSLRDIELLFVVSPTARATTPLFPTSLRERAPLTGALLDKVHSALFTAALGPEKAKCFSVHSGRIELACRLLGAGAPPGLIQALVRWKSAESLAVYARINPDDYMKWIRRAAAADPSSVQSHNLPTIDWDLSALNAAGVAGAALTETMANRQ